MNALRSIWSPSTSILRTVVAAVAGPALITTLAALRVQPDTAAIGILYVLAVVLATRVGGYVAGLAASILSFLSLNFFFTPPLHTFVVGTIEDLVALIVFLVTSAIVGLLVSSADAARARSERREMEARLVERLATRLLSGDPTEKVLIDFAGGLRSVFDLSCCEISTIFTTETIVSGEQGVPQGEATEILLSDRAQEIGLLRVWPSGSRKLSDDDQAVLRSLATQLALALEGTRLNLKVRRAELEAQANELKAALFSSVTHDVKTPLAAIMASVTSLIDGKSFSEQDRREHLETIRQEAERLHRVVNNLLDVARLRAGTLIANKVPSPIEEVLESVIIRLRHLLEGREVELRVADDIPEAPMDVVQIDQVLTNLIENAVKFTPVGSSISLSVVGSQNGVRVTVADKGPGVDKADRSRIFEPFERGRTTTSGTGLGLAIANAIVIAHGGRLWVAEAPSGGAAFTFELPGADGTAGEVVMDAGASSRR